MAAPPCRRPFGTGASWLIIGFAVIGGIIGTTLGLYKEWGYFEGKVVAILCGGAGALLGS